MNIRAAALNTPVSVMETAGEGGAWGMALLASYMVHKKDGETYVETECSHLLLGERYPLIISESPPTPSQASVSQPLFLSRSIPVLIPHGKSSACSVCLPCRSSAM